MTWNPFEDGATVGALGTEAGSILLDEEHADGARITLETGGTVAPYAITCGIYGTMVHTVFVSDEKKAQLLYLQMKVRLEELLTVECEESDYIAAIEKFVAEFQ